SLDVVEDFHRFDHAHIRFFIDFGADADERLRIRGGGGVKRADHRTLDWFETGFFINRRRWRRRAAATGTGRRGCHRWHRHHHRRGGAALEDDPSIAIAHV